jgi:hypothetical protein
MLSLEIPTPGGTVYFMKTNPKEDGEMTSRRRFLGQLSAASFCAFQPLRLLGAVAPRPDADAALAGPAEWECKSSTLMTRWSAQVNPLLPWPEYPRPQLARDEWLNLNGIWEYQPATEADRPPFGRTLAGSICVPFGVESALSGVMESHDRLWYRRGVAIPDKWLGKRILLHFEAVDWEAEVYVNGRSVGVHRGGYDPFTWDITPYLRPGAENELIVRVFDPTEHGGQPRGKQAVAPGSLKYTATSGIWQTVWLEPVADSYIEDMLFNPDIDNALVGVTVKVARAAADATVEVTVRDGGKPVATISTAPDKVADIAIPNPKPWSPESPFLYDVEMELKQGGRTVDRLTSYFGMRKHSLGSVKEGEIVLMLNNKPVFELGTLDQGFWPDGIYTAPTDDALRFDIEVTKAMGFNMIRKHVKVESRRWYHWCDKLGILVWQDMPNTYTRDGKKKIPPANTEAVTNELQRMVLLHRNAPSIVQWVIFNEGQSQKFFDTEKMVGLVRANDPTPRTINEASGGRFMGFADVVDVHTYPEPSVNAHNGRQAMVNGEFGGIGWLIPEHAWEPKGGGKVNVSTSDDLYHLYAELMGQVEVLKDKHGLSGTVYTQLTDTETEVNGLLCYDRVPKVPIEKIRAANEFRLPSPRYKDILPLSQTVPQTWKYTFDEPGGGPNAWSKARYDDTQWKEGPGGFGAKDKCDHVGTDWPIKTDLWLRRRFQLGALTPDEINRTVFNLYCLGLMGETYFNGVKFVMQHTANRLIGSLHEHRPLTQEARRALVLNGENVIAIHCAATTHPKYVVDVGFAVREG